MGRFPRTLKQSCVFKKDLAKTFDTSFAFSDFLSENVNFFMETLPNARTSLSIAKLHFGNSR